MYSYDAFNVCQMDCNPSVFRNVIRPASLKTQGRKRERKEKEIRRSVICLAWLD
jgi:hypothetical protein